MRNYERLETFLNQRIRDIYPEPLGEPHLSITARMVPALIDHHHIQPGAKVLDVGCGHALALKAFQEAGYEVTGIAFGEEARRAREQGFQIIEQDMSFLDIEDESYDVIWARHVIEHSIFPYFTITEMHRLLRPDGVFYMEVPGPATACRHETNANHYSVMGPEMWSSLLERTGFQNIRQNNISFHVPAGDDTYYAFDCTKPSTTPPSP
ncbi:MAG: class I SAM-dependent methyltransferase [Rhodospirillales bacterium]